MSVTAGLDDHQLRYRARSSGLVHLGIADCSSAHWYCTCGDWVKNRDLQGRPFRETALKHHAKHVRQAAKA